AAMVQTIAEINIPLNQGNLVRYAQNEELFAFVSRTRKRYIPPMWMALPADKKHGTPDLSQMPAKLRQRFDGTILPNSVTDRSKRVAVVLPIFEFGGVERVAFRVAKELTAKNFCVDLIVCGRNSIKIYDDFFDVFSNLYILEDSDFNSFTSADYRGTRLPSEAIIKKMPELTNLLLSYSIVIAHHSADALVAASKLRQAGVIFVNYLHLIEYSDKGVAVGHPIIGEAYEHAVDVFACCSNQLSAELGALGIPRAKIVTVPNGPGGVITTAEIQRSMDARSKRRAQKLPLRVLYMGRLDRQKGIDRLEKVINTARELDLNIEFRIVGGYVVDNKEDAGSPTLMPLVEPPIYQARDVVNALTWADVLLLPSRFEGLPLILIEAMQLGLVPISTDVGAVSELVRHGENGFLVQAENVNQAFLDSLIKLSEDPTLLERLSIAAASDSAARQWPSAVEHLLDAIARARRVRGITADAYRLPAANKPASGLVESQPHPVNHQTLLPGMPSF
ncbi:MAG: glycosyltransferase family 4 protein, partial [Burkholderiales bacterium]|nr:glycosyltransferase family 4 protein [Burkholderiales bacterium]